MVQVFVGKAIFPTVVLPCPTSACLMKESNFLINLSPFQVVSDRMQKSVLVAVKRLKFFPKYKVSLQRSKKFMVRQLCTLSSVSDPWPNIFILFIR